MILQHRDREVYTVWIRLEPGTKVLVRKLVRNAVLQLLTRTRQAMPVHVRVTLRDISHYLLDDVVC